LCFAVSKGDRTWWSFRESATQLEWLWKIRILTIKRSFFNRAEALDPYLDFAEIFTRMRVRLVHSTRQLVRIPS